MSLESRRVLNVSVREHQKPLVDAARRRASPARARSARDLVNAQRNGGRCESLFRTKAARVPSPPARLGRGTACVTAPVALSQCTSHGQVVRRHQSPRMLTTRYAQRLAHAPRCSSGRRRRWLPSQRDASR
eukprot:scaffold60387_cov70-Phaeocystis_antarctica.AAC.3